MAVVRVRRQILHSAVQRSFCLSGSLDALLQLTQSRSDPILSPSSGTHMKQYCARFMAVLAAALLSIQVQAQEPSGTPASTSGQAVRRSKPVPHVYPSLGTIERNDPALDLLIPADAKIELLASGFSWS